MSRLISLALAMVLLAGAAITLGACESTQQTNATRLQFDQPFDGSWFKGRRD